MSFYRSAVLSSIGVAAMLWLLWLPSDAAGEETPDPTETEAGIPAKTGINLRVQEFPLVAAPRKPLDLWALNFAYASPQGTEIVMSLVQCDYQGQQNWEKAIDYNQRMRSTDNGRNWVKEGPSTQNGPYEVGAYCAPWMHFLDQEKGALLSVFVKSDGVYYEISRDGGRTWSSPRQVIHQGSQYDSTHWMPGITMPRQKLVADQSPFARLDDGVIVCGFSLEDQEDPAQSGTVFLRARWNRDATDLDWDIGAKIIGPAGAGTVCEPDLVHLGGQRLFTTMRCQGSQKEGIYSTRQCAVSEDGGRSWSKPEALKYDDGGPVFVPAALSAFERDPATGKIYWFANILDSPVYGQGPRTPLTIAELDAKKLCVIRESVTPIIPPCTPKPPYSNFGHYVDRQSGEFVIVPAEQIPFRVDFQTDPYYGYRVKVLAAAPSK